MFISLHYFSVGGGGDIAKKETKNKHTKQQQQQKATTKQNSDLFSKEKLTQTLAHSEKSTQNGKQTLNNVMESE